LLLLAIPNHDAALTDVRDDLAAVQNKTRFTQLMRTHRFGLLASCAVALSLWSSQVAHAQPWQLVGITGQQGNDDIATYPDNTLFDINLTTGALAKLFTATYIPDSHSIGYNPVSGLLYHTGGANAYRDDPTRTGTPQGGEPIPGLAFQDNYYVETINLATQVATGVINNNPCPNPDPLLPCFGLVAPRPTWALPAERRTSDQTDPSFRQRGPNEYSALRGMAWSAEKNLFYVSDGEGIFKLTPTGDSTFLARPGFPIDGKVDVDKAIGFVVTTNLLVGHRDGAVDPVDEIPVKDGYLMRLNPETGAVLGQLRLTYPEGGGEPVGAFGGLLGMSQHPVTGVLYGLRQTADPMQRELVTINPETGATKLVGVLGKHIASIAFAQSGQSWQLVGITGQQGNDDIATYPDNTLFDINLTTGALTKLFTATYIPDSHSIGYNPVSGLLYHTGGAAAYRDDPTRTGTPQGGDPIPGLAFQDNYYVETINLATQVATGVINANPCPNPDPNLPCFGLVAPRPTWALPAERRTSEQTDPSFRQRGPDEYSALRGMAWSAEKKLFYVSDGEGIFKLTPTGESTFLSRPAFPIDGKVDVAKAIAFVVTTNLLVGHRDGAVDPADEVPVKDGYIMRLNPETGAVLGQLRLTYPEGGGEPVGEFAGLLGLAQHPVTGVLYGLRQTADPMQRELVTINPETGATKLVGVVGKHIASIAFAQAAQQQGINVSITRTGNNITLAWTGGTGPWVVQKKISLTDPTWMNVASTSQRTVTLPAGGDTGFFRIAEGVATAGITTLSASLNGANERPTPVNSSGSGFGILTIEGDTLTFDITFKDLNSNADRMHIHGYGTTEQAVGVIINLEPFLQGAKAQLGRIKGSVTLDATQKAGILGGQTYVNVHSLTVGSGEIRGQIVQ
jgi:hypothetical protein